MKSSRRLLISASLLVAAALGGAYFVSRPSRHRPVPVASLPVAEPKPAPVVKDTPLADVRPSAETQDDMPRREVAEEPQASRVRKDQNGNAILETVMTPDGPVSIQRTFTATGELVRERAFLNGRAVPVPSQK